MVTENLFEYRLHLRKIEHIFLDMGPVDNLRRAKPSFWRVRWAILSAQQNGAHDVDALISVNDNMLHLGWSALFNHVNLDGVTICDIIRRADTC